VWVVSTLTSMWTISAADESLLYSSDDVRGSILGDHPNDDPPHSFEFSDAGDVFDVLPPVAAMVVAVVFGGHHEVLPR